MAKKGEGGMQKILMVEDDEGLMRGVTFTLKKEGYDVCAVTTIGDAKKRLLEESFDLMLLDLNLPDGDGLDLCEWVRIMCHIALHLLILMYTKEILRIQKQQYSIILIKM